MGYSQNSSINSEENRIATNDVFVYCEQKNEKPVLVLKGRMLYYVVQENKFEIYSGKTFSDAVAAGKLEVSVNFTIVENGIILEGRNRNVQYNFDEKGNLKGEKIMGVGMMFKRVNEKIIPKIEIQAPVVLNKNTIHIKNLEISTKDLPREHSFWDANNACMSLGNGWNLPTREEFLLIVGEPADNAALPYCGSQYSRLEALSFRTDMYYAMGRDEMACVMDFNVSKLSYITDASLYKIALPTRCVLHYTDIIGTPIKLNNLEIAQHDFKNPMKYDEATYACNQLGDGWRLPTSDELKSIALSIDSIGSPGFCAGASYWSSTNYETGLKEIPKDIVIKTSVWLEFKRPYTGTTSGVFISLPTFPEFANNPYSGRYIAIKKGYEYPLMVRAVRTIN
jgi:hypothetical protein